MPLSEVTSRAISLAALTVLEVAPWDAIEIAARAGYSHIGLRPVAATPTEPHWPILHDAPNRRRVKHALAATGLAVLDVEILRLIPDIDWDAMTAVCEFAAEFGADKLLVADNDPDPVRCKDSLARLADVGAAFGVTPHIEFMPWTHAPNLAAAAERVSGIDNAAVLIDSFHLARSGGSLAEVAACDVPIRYLQLGDIAGPIPDMNAILAEARANRLMPGEGEIDLIGLLRTCPDVPISLEIPADRLRDAGVGAAERAGMAIAATHRILELADLDEDRAGN